MSVRMVQLRCPNCDAFMEIEDDIEICYCKYCGTRILLDDRSPAAISAKTKLKLADKVIKLREKRYEQRRYEMEAEAKESASNDKLILFLLALFLTLMLFFGVYIHFAVKAEKKDEANEVFRLETLLAEVQNDIANGDYNSALLKSYGLRYSIRPGSDLYSEQWDQTRETMIQIIQEEKAKTG